VLSLGHYATFHSKACLSVIDYETVYYASIMGAATGNEIKGLFAQIWLISCAPKMALPQVFL
jgi:hypothetical protein